MSDILVAVAILYLLFGGKLAVTCDGEDHTVGAKVVLPRDSK